MRLGLAGGLIPTDPDALDDEVAKRIARLGFRGLTLHFGAGTALAPDDLDHERCLHIRETLERYDLRVVQSWAFRANLVHPDADVRRRQVGLVGRAMRLAADLGADGVIAGAGSVDPAGGYAPHPGNHTAEAADRLVASLNEVAAHGEQHGLPLVLECHVLTALDTPERVHDVLSRVDSPFVRVNLDPANFVGSLADLYDSTALIERMFATLGDLAVSGHVKDVDVGNEFVLHLDETFLGEGRLDLPTYLRFFEERLPNAFLFVEHVSADLVPAAKKRLDRLVADLGIVEDPR